MRYAAIVDSLIWYWQVKCAVEEQP